MTIEQQALKASYEAYVAMNNLKLISFIALSPSFIMMWSSGKECMSLTKAWLDQQKAIGPIRYYDADMCEIKIDDVRPYLYRINL